ncbi:MAG: abortive infection family protein [Desulfitobacterium hafniense]|nr:abortive infection family protein [Desulfitobacterium hafniense]
MLFSKLTDEILEPTLTDFCETKRFFLSEALKNYILFGRPYYGNGYRQCLVDLNDLLMNYEIEDVLDFLDILIANFNSEILTLTRYSEIQQLTNYKNYFIKSLNETFQHNKLGFQVENDVIVTKESDFLHQEVVVKPLTLLANEDFKGALEEFTKAIDFYTKGDNENAILESCKAYESTIKSILDKLEVAYVRGANIPSLLALLKNNHIFDAFLDNMYSSLNSILSSGVNSIRNNQSGHGDGSTINEVERSYASLAINLAGSNIVFLIDRYYEVTGE